MKILERSERDIFLQSLYDAIKNVIKLAEKSPGLVGVGAQR